VTTLPGRHWGKLALVETRLFLREKLALLGVFGFPVGLVIGFSQIPGFRKPQASLGGEPGTEYIAALGVAICLGAIALQGLPTVIAQYRERGILRRLGVTPVRPLTLLTAKLSVWAVVAVLSTAIVVTVSRVAFHVPLPARFGWFVLSLVLAIVALIALGMLVTAVSPTVRGAGGLGMVLWFANMFLAGVWVPSNQLSPGLQKVGNLTPLGSALHSLRDSWQGTDPRLEYLGIMAAWAIVAGGLAARFFRWDSA
jgi:ABC-2 type transport system permease protein